MRATATALAIGVLGALALTGAPRATAAAPDFTGVLMPVRI